LERAKKQVDHELDLIARLGFAGYFLIVWDIVCFCKRNDILIQGRGSAANSAVCYALEITAIDPVGMELLFERFLSESRGEWPDIDLDLPSEDKREQAIQYVYQRYGELGAAMTANVITFLAPLHFAAKLVPCVQASYSCCVRSLPCDFEDIAKTVIVKAAHRVEVRRERIAMTCLQLRDKLLDVGGDDLFGGPPLLRLFGVWGGRDDIVGSGGGLHGCFLLGLGRCFSCHAWHVPTCRTPPGEGGGSKAQWGGVSPTLGEGAEGGTERAERSGGLHKRSAEDWGDPLRRAIGAEPLSKLVYLAGRGAQEL